MSETPVAPYVAPALKGTAFSCPHCHAFANQLWSEIHFKEQGVGLTQAAHYLIARCAHCRDYSMWRQGRMIYPIACTAPVANQDLPETIREDYEEARAIAGNSPRGACALLRLAIQKLCQHLGQPGEKLNDDIGMLVKDYTLSPKVQKALDIVRVLGNNAVHPGQIDLKDDVDTANKLFGLVNLIADATITHPKHVDELYGTLSEGQRDAIEKRDGA